MHKPPRLAAVLFRGTVAAILSSLVIMASGRMERGRALATHNGPSQWLYGPAAGFRRKVTLRHTLTGFVIHHASACWWAFVQLRLFPSGRRMPLRVHVAQAAAVAVAANVVDYQLVPERFQPGFEKHISRGSLAAAYVAFGVGLALAAWLESRDTD